jgi:hypothetical protein
VPEDGDEHAVRVARVDDDLGDLLRVGEAQVRPRLPAVGGLEDPVAGGEVGALQPLAAAGVDHVGVRFGDGEGADGAGRLVVEDRRPHAPVVVRAPDAAVVHADVERPRPRRDAHGRDGPPAAERPDHPPAQPREHPRVHLRGQRG